MANIEELKRVFIEKHGGKSKAELLALAFEQHVAFQRERMAHEAALTRLVNTEAVCNAMHDLLTANDLELDGEAVTRYVAASARVVVEQAAIAGEAYRHGQGIAVATAKSESAKHSASKTPQVAAKEAKTAEMRALWATGNYKSRNICAEQECDALGVSCETAREYLSRTPDPDPWPAKGR